MLALLERHRWFFLAFTVAGLALRAFFAAKFPQVTPDSLLYADLAKNWLAHGIYGQTDPSGILPTYVRLPGYPAFLAAVFAVFGKDNYRAVFALQVLIDLGTCFLLTDAARRCIRNERATQAAFALTALVAVGSLASSTHQADAKPFGLGWGIGAGIVGAAVVGSAIAASNDGYYGYGYRRCGWVRQFDAYGNYMGRVRTCGY